MIIALNNKCNLKKEDFLTYQKELETIEKSSKIILCPTNIFIGVANLSNIELGAQNVSSTECGAYTGEVSASQLKSMEVKYCIVGHSERRKYQQETNKEINEKVKNLLREEIIPILCIGESKEERENNQQNEVIINEIEKAISDLNEEIRKKIKREVKEMERDNEKFEYLISIQKMENTMNTNLKITGNGVNQALVGQTDAIGNKSASTSASFTPSEAGTYTFNLTGDITDFDTEVTSNISKSITIKVNPKQNTSSGSSSETKTETPNKSNVPTETTQNKKTETTKSSNNYLSGITLSTGTLSPEFYRETFEYTVEFDDTVNLYELTEMEITAQAEDSRASIQGAGTVTLNEGENSFSINVTAEKDEIKIN